MMGGPELREWRERVGWTQQQLADALDVAENTVARWERGEMAIQHPTILALALRWLGRRKR